MAGVKALRASGRSITHQAIDPERSRRSIGVPSSWSIRSHLSGGTTRPVATIFRLSTFNNGVLILR